MVVVASVAVSSATLAFAALALVGCQLGDDKDPPTCEKGFHVELSSCQPDKISPNLVTIKAACAVDPETIHVKLGDEFQYHNTDTVAHDVTGTIDGSTWLTGVKPNSYSAFASITKAGTWGYRISGCDAKTFSVVIDP